MFVLSSCSHRILDFTLISSKNVDLSRGASFVRGKYRVQGNDVAHFIFIIPTGTVSVKEALDRAIETTPGCIALLDGVIYQKNLMFIFYGQQKIIVEGLPLIDPGLAENTTSAPIYRKIKFNKNGDVEEIEDLSSFEYIAEREKITKESHAKNFVHSNLYSE